MSVCLYLLIKKLNNLMEQKDLDIKFRTCQILYKYFVARGLRSLALQGTVQFLESLLFSMSFCPTGTRDDLFGTSGVGLEKIGATMEP